MIGVYKFENTINGKVYIGQSVQAEERYRQHVRAIDNYKIDTKFYRALRKYGIEKFEFKIIEVCNVEDLNEREMYWIKFFNSRENGYNTTEGADFNPSNYPEIVEKRRQTLLYNEEVNAKLSQKGEDNPRAILSENDVKTIRTHYAEGKSFADSYSEFSDKISRDGFQACWLGQSWKEIMPEVFENRRKNNGGSDRSREEIYQLRIDYMEGLSRAEIKEKYGFSTNQTRRILKLERWKYPETIPDGYEEFISE